MASGYCVDEVSGDQSSAFSGRQDTPEITRNTKGFVRRKEGNSEVEKRDFRKRDFRNRYKGTKESSEKTIGGGGGDHKGAVNLVMGKFRLLRRGESFDRLEKGESENQVTAEEVAISKPAETSPTQIHLVERSADRFAGWAFVSSPAPHDLPLPSFCRDKKQ